MDRSHERDDWREEFVSTGRLPAPERVAELVEEAHLRYRSDTAGENSQAYPALARAPRELFGLCVAATNGDIHAAGEADVEFTIMSVSKPFVFALACQSLSAALARERIGVNGTGLPFNSLEAIDRSEDGRTNPMVNPGAIATTSMIAGATLQDRWRIIRDGLSRFAGRELELDAELYGHASETNERNRTIASVLARHGRIYCDPDEALELYTKQCCLRVSARDLAIMGATLADGGVNPISGERVVEQVVCRHTLAVMTIAGLYETSGDWLYDVGLPGKSGIGGGIVTVSPGKGGLGTFAPPLDTAGNSVKGQLAAHFLSARLGLDLFASEPAG